MRVGIIGSGIAGLFAAFVLRRDGHDVTIFENQQDVGIGAHSLFFDEWNCFGDVPSRMFNPLLWPKLFELYNQLGIEVEPIDATQSFSDVQRKTFLNLDVAYRPQALLPALFSGRSRRILLDSRRLLEEGPELMADLDLSVTFSTWLEDYGVSDDFRYGFLYPTLSSTVCTCSYSALDNYPALILLDTLQKLTAAGMAGSEGDPLLWRVKNGTGEVAQRLAHDIEDVRLATRVTGIARAGNEVSVCFNDCKGRSAEEHFDHVVVATQANTASELVTDLRDNEREMLGQFDYESVHVYVHQDESWMPKRQQSWGTFNQILLDPGFDRTGSEPSDVLTAIGYDAAYCSVWMNRFHRWETGVPNFFQTISSEILGIEDPISEVHFQRPVVTNRSHLGWQLRSKLHGESDRRLWFVGSYASRGVPLLETGIESVLELPFCLVVRQS